MAHEGRVRVELQSSEAIVERGTAKVSWLVRVRDAWVLANELPGATVERLEAGAGTVWCSRTLLELAPGTQLMRVESRPAPAARQDAFDYLAGEVRQPRRRVRRTTYRVGRRGELERDERAGRR